MCSECRLCICVLLHLLPLLSSFKLALTDLVSFPGSYMGREKRGTHCLCILSWILEISVNSVHCTNLRMTCWLFLPEKCLPLTTFCVNDDKGAIKGNKLFTYRNYPCIRAFQLNAMARDWRNLSLWSLLIVVNEVMQTVNVRTILFLTLKPPEGISQAV